MCSTLICIKSGKCTCGHEHVTVGCIYNCEEMFEDVVVIGPLMFRSICHVEGCTGHLVGVTGKDHLFCSALFEPFDNPDREIIESHEPKIDLPKKVPENV